MPDDFQGQETLLRITCDIPARMNDWGRHPKMICNVTPQGIWVHCRCCRKAHFVERERVLEIWEPLHSET